MATLATLTVDLLGNSAKLNSELRKANKNTKGWADKTRRQVGSAAKGMSVAGAAGAASLALIYAQAAKSGDQLAKFSDELGEVPERLTALHHAAELTGVSQESLNSSIGRMTKRIGEAKFGVGAASKTLERFGLANDEFFARSPADQFAIIADKVNGLSSQQEKAAEASALFGREGTALINTLALGSDGLAAMEAEAQALGLTLNRVQLAKIEAANDEFHRASQVTGAFGKTLATELAPFVGAISSGFVEAAKEAGGFGLVAADMVSATAKGVGFVADAGHGLKVVFLGVRQAIAEIANGMIQMGSVSGRLAEGLAETFGFDYKNGFVEFADSFSETNASLREELQQAALEPMPSAGIEEWVADVQKKAQVAAEKVAADRSVKVGGVLVAGPVESSAGVAAENDRVVSLTQERFRRLHEEALQAEGKRVEIERERHQREQAEFDADIARLSERGLLTAEVEAQARQAREDSELIHQKRLTEIEQGEVVERQKIQSDAMQQRGANYSALLNIADKYYEGATDSESRYARVAIQAGRELFNAKKRDALKQATIAGKVAIQEAWASSAFPYNLPSVAMATAETAANISSIAGIAHGGLENVPAESTYLLEKGERVLSPNQNSELTDFMRSGGGGGVVVNINNTHSGAAVRAEQNGDGQIEIIVERVKSSIESDVGRGAGIAPAFEQTYGLTRRGMV